MKRYTYVGDRMTDPELKGQLCTAVLQDNDKCIRGRNGSMLVQFDSGRVATVIGRLLRKVDK
ncbi:hypothetical protein EXU85_20495 [Spirosoma sp. KCTC 42546]|uniref:hypothetical protein n=1 Tax=Spirosoma sp. KCTC 42546 TaxID=2520506 RepID=UPI00115859C2|nr:hypothetical protein [Spirosoma sp. KCTC 42546]QDK80860.1 hypothetical protein EXU85_20495 [Spirosoma sp. KCTC 42546]